MPSEQNYLGAYKKLHKAFVFILAILVSFLGLKYQGSFTNLISEHSVAFHLFLGDLIVYTVAILLVAQETPAPNIIPLFNYILLVCGVTAVELILFILVTQLGWFLVISAFGLLLYNYGYWVLTILHDFSQQALTRFQLTPGTTEQEEGRDVPGRRLCNLFRSLRSEDCYWFNMQQFLARFSSAANVTEEPNEAGDGVEMYGIV
ncbi:hypothetical protein PanWU01x14_147400 [Parasponia andersonii]|uniref:Transmembrane protein n=1 Tax=Parasponia andersonii TaxID=3476 RepID=A0A2P5CJC6_PARAD|nr:hypothetical protein PanWU01x14_147400 [Parasponia andersonii]